MVQRTYKDKNWNFPTCKLCSYRSKSAFLLRQHEKLHEARLKTDAFTCHSKPPELYPCEFCGFETNLKVDLTEHFRISHEGKEEEKELKNILKCYRCKNCDFEAHSVLVLTNHTDDCYSHKLEDEGCLKTNVLLEHSYSISVKQYITWNCTNNWFKRNSMLSNTSEYQSGLNCRQCGYQFKFIYNLKEHIRLLHPSPADIKWLQCDQCEYKCKRKYNLTEHIKSRHTAAEDLQWFECGKCQYKYKLKRTLKLHISTTHTKEEVWLQCEQCAFQSKHKKHLKLHTAVHENPAGIKWFVQCGLCEFISCKLGTSLRLHFSRKHAINLKGANGLKPERNALSDLEQQSVEHPKDLCWFRCAQCHYRCKRKVNVKKHIATKHNAQNPGTISWFKCTECSFKSKFEDSLKMHHMLREHLNLEDTNWIQCPQCVFKTRDKLALKRHILHNHFI